MSVSLNEADADAYCALCHPQFGEVSYEAILTYIQDVKNYVDCIAVSVVSCISSAAIEKCRKIAEDLGVDFKIR